MSLDREIQVLKTMQHERGSAILRKRSWRPSEKAVAMAEVDRAPVEDIRSYHKVCRCREATEDTQEDQRRHHQEIGIGVVMGWEARAEREAKNLDRIADEHEKKGAPNHVVKMYRKKAADIRKRAAKASK
jgi:hypothetical protein